MNMLTGVRVAFEMFPAYSLKVPEPEPPPVPVEGLLGTLIVPVPATELAPATPGPGPKLAPARPPSRPPLPLPSKPPGSSLSSEHAVLPKATTTLVTAMTDQQRTERFSVLMGSPLAEARIREETPPRHSRWEF